jgi:hypothetical protein
MATLATLFQPLLPFTVTSPLVPDISSIYKYNFAIPSYFPKQTQSASLALVLIDSLLIAPLNKTDFTVLMTDLRAVLDPSWGDEVDGSVKGAQWEKLREKGLVIWTTFTWDVAQKQASAWMPESFVDGVLLKEQGWGCGLYRTDVWMPTFDRPAMVSELISKGENGENDFCIFLGEFMWQKYGFFVDDVWKLCCGQMCKLQLHRNRTK